MPSQFTHLNVSAEHSSLVWSVAAHFPHAGRFLQLSRVWPNRRHLKHRMGAGTYGRTLTASYPIFTSLGNSVRSNVKITLFVGTSSSPLLTRIRRAAITPKSARPSSISASLTPSRSRQKITPLEKFFVRWISTVRGRDTSLRPDESLTLYVKLLAIITRAASSHFSNSTSIPPSRNLSHRTTLPNLSQPSRRWKGDSDASGFSVLRRIKIRGVGASLRRPSGDVDDRGFVQA